VGEGLALLLLRRLLLFAVGTPLPLLPTAVLLPLLLLLFVFSFSFAFPFPSSSLSYDFTKFSGYTRRVLHKVLGTYPKLMCFTSTALQRPQGEFRQGFSPISPSIELGRSSPQFGGRRDSVRT
jgi:hypothetical protein